MQPQSLWHKYEQVIRKAAGLGRSPALPDPDRYEKTNHHCDVLVVGGGISGLCAAVSAARSGARVTLVDDQNEFGGRLLDNQYEIDSTPAVEYAERLVKELSGLDNVTLLPRTCVYGYLDHKFPGRRRESH